MERAPVVAAVKVVLVRVLSRTLQAAVLLAVLSVVLFRLLSSLPGDAVDLMVSANPELRPADVARLKRLRGYDQPWHVQYARWLMGHHQAHVPVAWRGPAEVAPDATVSWWKDLREHADGPAFDVKFVEGRACTMDGATRVAGRGAGTCVVVVATEAGLESAITLRVPGMEPAANVAGLPSVAVVDAGREVSVPLVADGTNVELLAGPGRVEQGRWLGMFEGPGQHVVVLRVGGALHAVEVDHGVAEDPSRHVPGFLHGNWGFSNTYKQPVEDILPARLAASMVLAVPAFSLALLLAVVLGTIAAARSGSWLDRAVSGAAFAAMSVPAFWLGLLAVSVFAVQLRWFPSGGMMTPGDGDLQDRASHAVLPVCILASAYAGRWLRFVRGAVKDVLSAPHVLAARARGLSETETLWRHALRAALVPLITAVALALPSMAAGAVLTETVFSWPGMGRLILESVTTGDHYVAMVAFLVVAALVQLSAGVADVLYAWADPRTRRPA